MRFAEGLNRRTQRTRRTDRTRAGVGRQVDSGGWPFHRLRVRRELKGSRGDVEGAGDFTAEDTENTVNIQEIMGGRESEEGERAVNPSTGSGSATVEWGRLPLRGDLWSELDDACENSSVAWPGVGFFAVASLFMVWIFIWAFQWEKFEELVCIRIVAYFERDGKGTCARGGSGFSPRYRGHRAMQRRRGRADSGQVGAGKKQVRRRGSCGAMRVEQEGAEETEEVGGEEGVRRQESAAGAGIRGQRSGKK